MSQAKYTLTVHAGPWQRAIHFLLDSDHVGQRFMLHTLQLNQMYEAETTAILDALLQPGDTFIDIGGHIGYFSLLAAALVGREPAQGPHSPGGGKVYVFEPEQANFAHLLTHIGINGYHNILPFHGAVGNATGIVELYVNSDNDGGHALWDPGKHPFNTKCRERVTKVPAFQIRLDDLFGKAPPGFAKLIKIDTEGNELNVLRGAAGFLLGAQVPAVVAEVNRFGLEQMGSCEADLRRFMRELGYTAYGLMGSLPTRLHDAQTFQAENVFNLLFASPQLQREVADKWPQMTP